MAHALGVLALVLAVFGATSWASGWHLVPALRAQGDAGHALDAGRPDTAAGPRAHRAPARPDHTLVVAPPGRDQEANLAPRSPSSSARARPQDGPDLRWSPGPDAAAVTEQRWPAASATGIAGPVAARRMAASSAIAPESAGDRTANPVRGPPARAAAST
ncbi:MAG: hypothetical protein QM820_46550 [Minicystis sp.]